MSPAGKPSAFIPWPWWDIPGACRIPPWRELLVGLKDRGLSIAPETAVGDRALGFWKALEEIFPSTRNQRCCQHKFVNILNKVPKPVQPNMKADLREDPRCPGSGDRRGRRGRLR